ncbi:MAG: DUF3429 domain-containing protein [Gammaproteobacteria bacterium]|nr:DUF3429 domain-containing protein [Gammaproteobacteria bacterium]
MLAYIDMLEHRAKWLGYLGLLPFAAGLVGLALIAPGSELVMSGVHGYGAVILTFVGAIHWGRAMASNDAALMTWSVLPSLVAWISLLLKPEFGLPVLILSFLSLNFFDQQQYQDAAWFRPLRFRLTAGVTILLTISWLLGLPEV